MKIDRVTMTGAGDSARPSDLLPIAARIPNSSGASSSQNPRRAGIGSRATTGSLNSAQSL
jgi:hypothetical protein